MDQTATITTIIPTFERAALLRRAVRSVLAQSYPHVRVCIYDNASSDDTTRIAAALLTEDVRVRYHRHPENIGSTPNFVFGMDRVDTPYFSLLSDDDVLLPSFYERALEGFRRHPEAIFSACSVIKTTPSGEVRHVPFTSWPRMGLFVPPDGLRAIVSGNHPTITGILFRTDVLRQCGTLDPGLTIADVDFEIRIALRFPFVTSAEPGALFVPHSGSEGERLELRDLWRQYQSILQKLDRDQSVPAATREVGLMSLRLYLRKAMRDQGLRAVARGALPDARVAAEALERDLDGRGAAALIRSLLTICRLPLVGKLFTRAYAAAKTARRRSLHHLQERYGAHTRHLRTE